MSSSIEDVIKKIKDAAEGDDLSRYLSEFSEIFNNVIKDGMLKKLQTGQFDFLDPASLEGPSQLFKQGINLDPAALLKTQVSFMQDQAKLWQQTTLSLLGGELTQDDVITAERGDSRFKNEQWSKNPLFNHIKQAYLLNSKFIKELGDSMSFKDKETEQQLKFYLRQFSSSLSPTNFTATNPEVCKEIIDSKGKNLVNGLKNFLADIEKSPTSLLNVSLTDADAFKLGVNVAVSPGQVVFQNELFQLIQYDATTKKVKQAPLLLIPPFINKFYIMDLSEKNSLVKWLTEQGFTVFMMSWVNPARELADKNFEDYMLDGVIAARDTITAITGEEAVNAVGYCVGGALLACAQAYLITTEATPFTSTSYFTSLMDFSKPGEPGVYLNEQFMDAIDKNAQQAGYCDGRMVAVGFSLLRENNLYWSYFVSNYLMGKDPAPFDLLYWNSDSSNIPAAMVSYYSKNMYLNNKLIEPGGITLAGVPIDLGKINTPAFFVSTINDHIAVWEGTYPGALAHGGDTRFLLAGSGHIAGIINPPAGNKYGYWTNEKLPDSAEKWMESSDAHEGSWWPCWADWAKSRSGKLVAARVAGSHPDYPALEPAPGSYVAVQCKDIN